MHFKFLQDWYFGRKKNISSEGNHQAFIDFVQEQYRMLNSHNQ